MTFGFGEINAFCQKNEVMPNVSWSQKKRKFSLPLEHNKTGMMTVFASKTVPKISSD